MDQVNNIDEGMVQQQPALGEGLRPQRRISSNNASKLPKYDPAESIDQYLARVDFWFELEGVFTEREKLRQLMPYLPGKMFGEVRNAGLQDHPEPYIELKRLLTTAFGLNELERVRKLTEAVQLGNRKPGDVLRDMQELAVTTDEKILKSLWLQRLPSELGAALSTSRDLPIPALREMANTIHGFMGDRAVAQISSPPAEAHHHPRAVALSQTTTPGLGELVSCINQLVLTMKDQHAATIAAIERRDAPVRSRSRSGQRGSFRDQRSQSSSSTAEPDFDEQGRCWYHRVFGDRARKCKPGCTLGGVRH